MFIIQIMNVTVIDSVLTSCEFICLRIYLFVHSFVMLLSVVGPNLISGSEASLRG